MTRLKDWVANGSIPKGAPRSCGNCAHGFRQVKDESPGYRGCPNTDCGSGTLAFTNDRGWQHWNGL
jgi:hypothetical protein